MVLGGANRASLMASISRFGVLSNVPARSKAGLSFRIPRVTARASFLLFIQGKAK